MQANKHKHSVKQFFKLKLNGENGKKSQGICIAKLVFGETEFLQYKTNFKVYVFKALISENVQELGSQVADFLHVCASSVLLLL